MATPEEKGDNRPGPPQAEGADAEAGEGLEPRPPGPTPERPCDCRPDMGGAAH